MTTKYLLEESRIPTSWVNLLPDLPGEPLPPLNPGTGQPAGPEDLTPIFPMGLIEQEVSAEPEVELTVVEPAPVAEPEPVLTVVEAAKPAAPREPDPAEISAPPASPKRGWWRRG